MDNRKIKIMASFENVSSNNFEEPLVIRFLVTEAGVLLFETTYHMAQCVPYDAEPEEIHCDFEESDYRAAFYPRHGKQAPFTNEQASEVERLFIAKDIIEFEVAIAEFVDAQKSLNYDADKVSELQTLLAVFALQYLRNNDSPNRFSGAHTIIMDLTGVSAAAAYRALERIDWIDLMTYGTNICSGWLTQEGVERTIDLLKKLPASPEKNIITQLLKQEGGQYHVYDPKDVYIYESIKKVLQGA